MTPSSTARMHPINAVHPLLTSLAGAGTHAIAMTLGYKYNVGYASLAVGAVVVAALMGTWAWAGTPVRLDRTSLGLAIVSAATIPGWWAGWPLVLGLTAVGLAVEHRRRVGSMSVASTIGLTVGLIGFGVSGAICLLG